MDSGFFQSTWCNLPSFLAIAWNPRFSLCVYVFFTFNPDYLSPDSRLLIDLRFLPVDFIRYACFYSLIHFNRLVSFLDSQTSWKWGQIPGRPTHHQSASSHAETNPQSYDSVERVLIIWGRCSRYSCIRFDLYTSLNVLFRNVFKILLTIDDFLTIYVFLVGLSFNVLGRFDVRIYMHS